MLGRNIHTLENVLRKNQTEKSLASVDYSQGKGGTILNRKLLFK